MAESTTNEIRIIFREWEFILDKAINKHTYDAVEGGAPEGCTCAPCKNFIHNREGIYPAEIKQLFSDLGGDYKKESEISHYCRLDNGLHLYGGWFHFKGRFIGPDCSVQDSDGKGTGFLEISENFEMGLLYGNFMSFFENREGLIQLEFSAKVPWTIDQALEPK